MSNDQIHNNLYLTVENSIEIGKGYQVTEKWVFFKLLLQPYKQTHLGVRITACLKYYLKRFLIFNPQTCQFSTREHFFENHSFTKE